MHQLSLITLVQLAAMLGAVAGAAVSIGAFSSSDVILTLFFPDRRKEIFCHYDTPRDGRMALQPRRRNHLRWLEGPHRHC